MLRTRVMVLLPFLCLVPAPSPAAMRQQRPPGLYIDLVSSNLSGWAPEGNSDGNSNQPSAYDRDLILTVRLTREGPPPPIDERIYTFWSTVYSTYNPGQFTNDPATLTDPQTPTPGIPLPLDAAFEETRNPNWQMVGPDLPYPDAPGTSQSAYLLGFPANDITAYNDNPTQPVPYGPGDQVTIRITSYDWAARGEIHVMIWTAGLYWSGPDPVPPAPLVISFPLDENGNEVADSRECNGNPACAKPQQSWTQKDFDNDEDLRTPNLHDFLGDGLTTWEESRGIRIGGVTTPVITLPDDGPNGFCDCSFTKGAFVEAPTHPTLGSLFPSNNPYLLDISMTWHRVASANVLPDPVDPGLAGFIEGPLTAFRQRVAKIQSVVLPPGAGGESTPSWQDGNPILVDPAQLIALTATYTFSVSDALKEIVAHELTHKLGNAGHFGRLRTYVAEKPGSPDLTKFWPIADNKIQYWTTGDINNAGSNYNDHEPFVSKNFEGTISAITWSAEAAPYVHHGVSHSLILLTRTYAGALTLDQSSSITTFKHNGLLMDAQIAFSDLEHLKAAGNQLLYEITWINLKN